MYNKVVRRNFIPIIKNFCFFGLYMGVVGPLGELEKFNAKMGDLAKALQKNKDGRIYKNIKTGEYVVRTDKQNSGFFGRLSAKNYELQETTKIVELAEEIIGRIDESQLEGGKGKNRERFFALSKDVISLLSIISRVSGSSNSNLVSSQLDLFKEGEEAGKSVTPFYYTESGKDQRTSGFSVASAKAVEKAEKRQLLKKKILELGSNRQKLGGLRALQNKEDRVAQLVNTEGAAYLLAKDKSVIGVGKKGFQTELLQAEEREKALLGEIKKLQVECGFSPDIQPEAILEKLKTEKSLAKVKITEVVQQMLAESVLVPVYEREAKEGGKARFLDKWVTKPILFTSDGRIDVGQKLGEGSSKVANLGKNALKTKQYAVLTFKQQMGEGVVGNKNADNEKAIYELVKDVPGCIKLEHVISYTTLEEGVEGFVEVEKYVFVMTLAEEGDLESYLKKESLNPQKKIAMAANIAKVVSDVHDKGVVINDLKASNFLMKEGQVLLSDLGTARYVGEPIGEIPSDELIKADKLKDFPGSAEYQPPEFHKAMQVSSSSNPEIHSKALNSLRDKKGDAWALGCLLFEMFHPDKQLPWLNPRLNEKARVALLRDLDLSEEYTPFPKGHIKTDVDLIIEGLLQVNPDSRMSVAEAQNRLQVIQEMDSDLTMVT